MTATTMDRREPLRQPSMVDGIEALDQLSECAFFLFYSFDLTLLAHDALFGPRVRSKENISFP